MFRSSHQYQLLNRLRNIDQVLAGPIEALDPGRQPSLFTTIVQDSTPQEREALTAHLELFRLKVRKFIEENHLDAALPPVSGVRSVRTALAFARTAVCELGPEHLRGCGQMDSRVICVCDGLVESLMKLLDCMSEDLGRHY